MQIDFLKSSFLDAQNSKKHLKYAKNDQEKHIELQKKGFLDAREA